MINFQIFEETCVTGNYQQLYVSSDVYFDAPDDYRNDEWGPCECDELVTDDDDVYYDYFMKYDNNFIKYSWMIFWRNHDKI